MFGRLCAFVWLGWFFCVCVNQESREAAPCVLISSSYPGSAKKHRRPSGPLQGRPFPLKMSLQQPLPSPAPPTEHWHYQELGNFWARREPRVWSQRGLGRSQFSGGWCGASHPTSGASTISSVKWGNTTHPGWCWRETGCGQDREAEGETGRRKGSRRGTRLFKRNGKRL